MYCVTRISPFGKRKVKICINEEEIFCLYNSEVEKLDIYEHENISPSKYDEIINITFKRAKERSLYIIERSSKTTYQIYTKLISEGYNNQIVEKVIDFLKKYNFLNDRNYAIDYINSNYLKKSKSLIINELIQRGIERNFSKELVEKMLPDERQLITQMINKKYSDKLNSSDEKQKAVAYLLRKGFKYDDISSIINDF